MTRKFTTKKNGAIDVLMLNDSPAPCPFRNPFIMPHPQIQGQAVLNVPTCDSSCIFFKANEKEVVVQCKGIVFELDQQ